VDKLVVLAGIVEQFHLVYNSKYLKGLWQKTLLLHLFWYNNSYKLKWQPTEYCTHFWSWASIDGHVISPNFKQELEPGMHNIIKCEVLDCQVTLASQDMPLARYLLEL
jgi:hypothetical protein